MCFSLNAFQIKCWFVMEISPFVSCNPEIESGGSKLEMINLIKPCQVKLKDSAFFAFHGRLVERKKKCLGAC